MATETIRVSAVIPAEPERIYKAWLDGDEHAKMTGGEATGEPGVGGHFTAWGGYIEGENLELEEGKRIVQSWRTSEFPEDAEPSRLEIQLEPQDGGTCVTIVHSNIPEGQGKRYESGWQEHYFEPMRKHFGGEEAEHEQEPAREAKPAEPTRAERRGRAPMGRGRAAAAAKKTAAKRPAKRATKAAAGAAKGTKRAEATTARKNGKRAAKPAKAEPAKAAAKPTKAGAAKAGAAKAAAKPMKAGAAKVTARKGSAAAPAAKNGSTGAGARKAAEPAKKGTQKGAPPARARQKGASPPASKGAKQAPAKAAPKKTERRSTRP